MTIEFQLARAFTAQSKNADPKQIRGGKVELTAEDVKCAVCTSLVEHPFAFHALMWKWCEDEVSRGILLFNLNDVALLNWHERYPSQSIRSDEHIKLIEWAIEYWCKPEMGKRMGDQGIANHMQIHRDTYQNKYRQHFNRVTSDLLEMEYIAMQDYKRVMKR
ncbi:hypothetical protein N9937_01260 [bacterium]|nr:hypothetical protein [bacterium]